jgi:hypothetical protein
MHEVRHEAFLFPVPLPHYLMDYITYYSLTRVSRSLILMPCDHAMHKHAQVVSYWCASSEQSVEYHNVSITFKSAIMSKTRINNPLGRVYNSQPSQKVHAEINI